MMSLHCGVELVLLLSEAHQLRWVLPANAEQMVQDTFLDILSKRNTHRSQQVAQNHVVLQQRMVKIFKIWLEQDKSSLEHNLTGRKDLSTKATVEGQRTV